jgi:hypothetical protein
MGTLNLQVGLNDERQADLAAIRKHRNVPSDLTKKDTFVSDGQLVKGLLLEKMDEILEDIRMSAETSDALEGKQKPK